MKKITKFLRWWKKKNELSLCLFFVFFEIFILLPIAIPWWFTLGVWIDKDLVDLYHIYITIPLKNKSSELDLFEFFVYYIHKDEYKFDWIIEDDVKRGDNKNANNDGGISNIDQYAERVALCSKSRKVFYRSDEKNLTACETKKFTKKQFEQRCESKY